MTKLVLANNAKLRGQFRVVKKIGDKVTYEGEWQDNLITDVGLRNISSLGKSSLGGSVATSLMKYLHLSSDNSQPSISDATIKSHIKTSDSGASYSETDSVTQYAYAGGADYSVSETFTYTFLKGANYNVSKLYLSHSSSISDPPFSAALIKDSNNVPATISVLEQEDLYIYYKIIQYVDLVVNNYSATINIRNQNKVFSVRSQPYAIGTDAWRFVSPSLSSFAIQAGNYVTRGWNTVAALAFPTNFTEKVNTHDGSYNRVGTANLPYDESTPLSRKYIASFTTDYGNYPNGLQYVITSTNRGVFIFEILDANGKGIPKTSFDTLSLEFTTSVARYEGV